MSLHYRIISSTYEEVTFEVNTTGRLCFALFFFSNKKKKIKFANRTITNIDFRKVIYQGAEL